MELGLILEFNKLILIKLIFKIKISCEMSSSYANELCVENSMNLLSSNSNKYYICLLGVMFFLSK